MSLFFTSALSGPARQFLLSNCSSHMPFEQIDQIMRRHYSIATKKLQMQSEIDDLDLQSFMHERQLVDCAAGLSHLVDHINSLALELLAGFNNDAHKTHYLRLAVMIQEWAQNAISSIASSKYLSIQSMTELQEILELREERRHD